MNKIIAFANQKGGVGKTTLCILFADYLAWKKKDVVLLDADDQRSVTTKREKDVEFFGEEPPYEVQHVGIQLSFHSSMRISVWRLRRTL